MFSLLKILSRIVFMFIIFSAVFSFSSSLYQQEKPFNDFKELSIENLLNQEIDIATKTTMRISKAPSIVAVITSKEIEDMGARDLRDVLRKIPGFEMGIRVFGYYEIGIRGVITDNSEKVKIMIDDIPVNEHLEGSGTIVFGDYSLEQVSRIEVIRGPGSALYGTSAFVGVINIVTKSSDEINGLKVYSNAGSFGTLEAGILFGHKSNDFRISGFANYLDTEGPSSYIPYDVLSGDPLNSDVSLAGTDRGKTQEYRKKLTAGMQLKSGNFYFKSVVVDVKKGQYLGTRWAVTEGSEAHPFQISNVLGYMWQKDESLSIESKVFYSYYKADNLWNSFPDGYRIKDPVTGDIIEYTQGQFDRQGGTQTTSGFEMRAVWDLNLTQSIMLGASYEKMRLFDVVNETNIPGQDGSELIDAGPIMLEEPTRKVLSSYLQYQWSMNKYFSVTAGLRYDKYNDAGSTNNPRLGLVWTINDKSTVKFLYGEAFRAPTFVESYLYAYGGFATGDKDNAPETIKTDEIEIAYRFTDNLHGKINFFRNSINNLIRLIPLGDHLEYTNIKEGTTINGLEAELRGVYSNSHYWYLNCSIQHGESDLTGEDLFGMAHFIGNAGYNVEVNNRLNINISMTRVGSRHRPTWDTRDSLKGYSFASLAFRYKNIMKNLDLTFSIYNLLDSDIRYVDLAGTIPEDFPIERRNYMFGLKYHF